MARLRDTNTRRTTFSEVVKAYSEPLYWHIRRMVLSHDDANDLLQNTFVKAWTGIDGFLGNAKVLTWLYRIATNETLTFMSKNNNVPIEDINAETMQIESDTWFDGNEIQARLQAAIQTLPPKQRMVFSMKYFPRNEIRGDKPDYGHKHRCAKSLVPPCREENQHVF